MYADDTTVFVNDTDSILHLLNMLQKFSSISGLQVNTSKTEALWLGCCHSALKYWQDYRPMFSEDMTQAQNEII